MLIAFQFRPKLLDSLKGYGGSSFAKDLSAGITVSVVALPLALAFAMASGLKPEAGLFTAIIAGFLVSALGGSKVLIGGPAGAFIVIVYGILERYGAANLIIATVMSGVMLFAMGFFKLGVLIRFVPVAVIIGFTNGIAVLIMLSQIKDFLGLEIAKMPGSFFGILQTIASHLHTLKGTTLTVALGSLVVIVAWGQLPKWAAKSELTSKLALVPGSIVALVLATAAVFFLGLEVATIGTRFGGIPSVLPQFALPNFSWETVRFLIVPATTLALLGAIESLLCCRVADGLVGDRHDSNQELMAQGIANFITPFFGGMAATGTVARTMTNIKSGAVSPVAGMVHAVVLLLVMLLAAPLATHIPLAVLAAILVYVAWNMGQWREFVHLRQFRMPYRVTLLAVFFLTVVFDLTVAVEVGLIAACVTFIYRISSLSRCERVAVTDQPLLAGQHGTVAAYRLYGALFFGAFKLLEDIERTLPSRALVLDLKNLIYMDSSGVDALMDLVRLCNKTQVQLVVCGLTHQPLDIAQRSGLLKLLGPQRIQPDLARGLKFAAEHLTA